MPIRTESLKLRAIFLAGAAERPVIASRQRTQRDLPTAQAVPGRRLEFDVAGVVESRSPCRCSGRAARFRKARTLSAGTCRAGVSPLLHREIPNDANFEWTAHNGRRRRPDYACRPGVAPDESGRAAAIMERSLRRDEPRRTASRGR